MNLNNLLNVLPLKAQSLQVFYCVSVNLSEIPALVFDVGI